MTAQRLLFAPEDLAPAPRARRTDPAESHGAAARSKRMSHAHNEWILGVLRCSVRSLNCHQIADLTARTVQLNGRAATESLTQVQVARRMAALLEVGLVMVDGTSERGRLFRIVTPRDRAIEELGHGS